MGSSGGLPPPCGGFKFVFLTGNGLLYQRYNLCKLKTITIRIVHSIVFRKAKTAGTCKKFPAVYFLSFFIKQVSYYSQNDYTACYPTKYILHKTPPKSKLTFFHYSDAHHIGYCKYNNSPKNSRRCHKHHIFHNLVYKEIQCLFTVISQH